MNKIASRIALAVAILAAPSLVFAGDKADKKAEKAEKKADKAEKKEEKKAEKKEAGGGW